jgi:hypothetical protein
MRGHTNVKKNLIILNCFMFVRFVCVCFIGLSSSFVISHESLLMVIGVMVGNLF